VHQCETLVEPTPENRGHYLFGGLYMDNGILLPSLTKWELHIRQPYRKNFPGQVLACYDTSVAALEMDNVLAVRFATWDMRYPHSVQMLRNFVEERGGALLANTLVTGQTQMDIFFGTSADPRVPWRPAGGGLGANAPPRPTPIPRPSADEASEAIEAATWRLTTAQRERSHSLGETRERDTASPMSSTRSIRSQGRSQSARGSSSATVGRMSALLDSTGDISAEKAGSRISVIARSTTPRLNAPPLGSLSHDARAATVLGENKYFSRHRAWRLAQREQSQSRTVSAIGEEEDGEEEGDAHRADCKRPRTVPTGCARGEAGGTLAAHSKAKSSPSSVPRLPLTSLGSETQPSARHKTALYSDTGAAPRFENQEATSRSNTSVGTLPFAAADSAFADYMQPTVLVNGGFISARTSYRTPWGRPTSAQSRNQSRPKSAAPISLRTDVSESWKASRPAVWTMEATPRAPPPSNPSLPPAV